MKLEELPVEKISPSVFQPRETFPKEELEELAKSMKEHGLINPILVKETGGGFYQIIAGERRWRAAQLVGMKKIFAFIKEVTDEQQRLESLIENIHRKDLNMIEKGRGMMEIFKIHKAHIDDNQRELTPKQIAGKIGHIRELIRKNKPLPIMGSLKKIYDVCLKIHCSLRTLEYWLESISVDDDVIKDHFKTPEEDRISETTIARISTIKNKELQKKTYSKIKSQELGQKKASDFVTKIKKLPEMKQEIALNTDIPIEVISEETEEDELELPKKELEKKYRQKMAQKVLRSDSRLSLMDREIPAKMIDEIYVGDIECPECGEILSLIHCEPGKVHKVERKPS